MAKQDISVRPPFDPPSMLPTWTDQTNMTITPTSEIITSGSLLGVTYLVAWQSAQTITIPIRLELMLYYRWSWVSDQTINISFPEREMSKVEFTIDPLAGLKLIGDTVVKAYKPSETAGEYVALIYQTLLLHVGTYIPSFNVVCHYDIPMPRFSKYTPGSGLYTVHTQFALHCTSQTFYTPHPRVDALEGWEVVPLTKPPD